MLQDVIQPPADQFQMENIMCSLSDAQILEFYSTSDQLPQETSWKLLQPRVSLCCSSCGGRSCGKYCDNIKNCYSDAASFGRTVFSAVDAFPPAAALDTKNPTFSDLSTSPPPTQITSSSFVNESADNNQFNQILVTDHDMLSGYTSTSESRSTIMTQLPHSLVEEETTTLMMNIPEFMGLLQFKTPSSTPPPFIDQSISSLLNGSTANLSSLYTDGMSPRSLLLRSDEAFQKLEKQKYEAGCGNSSFYRTDKNQQHHLYCSSNTQALVVGDQQCNGGFTSTAALMTSLPSSLVDESNFRAGRLSPEERKERINRYLKKKHERNFSKKIKYACRKTLADSRPRVRGRFAKNEDFGEAMYDYNIHIHDDEDEEQAVPKEEDPYLESFPQFNSFEFKYNLDTAI